MNLNAKPCVQKSTSDTTCRLFIHLWNTKSQPLGRHYTYIMVTTVTIKILVPVMPLPYSSCQVYPLV